MLMANGAPLGSYNLNHISDYGSVEMNVDILDQAFTEEFEKVLLKIIKDDCRQVTIEEYPQKKNMVFTAHRLDFLPDDQAFNEAYGSDDIEERENSLIRDIHLTFPNPSRFPRGKE